MFYTIDITNNTIQTESYYYILITIYILLYNILDNLFNI